MESDNLPAAIQGFEAVLQKDPTHHQSHGNLGLCHGMLGDKQKALAHLDKTLELTPDFQVAS